MGLPFGNDAAVEALPALEDLEHPLLDPGQVLGVERLGDLEVVVEPVLDRRSDAQFRLRKQVLDGLGQDVRGRMPQNGQALGVLGTNRLDHITRRDAVIQVAQFAVHACNQHGAVIAEHLASGRPGLDGARFTGHDQINRHSIAFLATGSRSLPRWRVPTADVGRVTPRRAGRRPQARQSCRMDGAADTVEQCP